MRIGTENINNGIRITAAHIDSPRLDLKPVPLYEEHGMSFFKTHYYGGVRKYQWLAMPLALHGVVVKQDGTVVEVVIGEDERDPVMYITDLLPHLARAQGGKSLNEVFQAEKLNILVGSRPVDGEDKDAVKAGVLNYLNEKYGITEEDFLSAELSIVPAAKARDVGFDRSMICAYGHDDRVCAYPSLTAMIDSTDTIHTSMCLLVDKEETGSDGVTGMQSSLIVDVIAEIAKALGGNEAAVRANSKCLSSDVTATFDPNYADVYEHRNSSLIGCGVCLCKYTGSGGKGGTSDASAEMVGWTRRFLNEAGVVWQISELGKTDVGGGGTVAKYMANHNIDTIDIGVGVLSMHAPYELIAKVDLYEAYRAFRAFYQF
jgi:aspartyl aminopeptidase